MGEHKTGLPRGMQMGRMLCQVQERVPGLPTFGQKDKVVVEISHALYNYRQKYSKPLAMISNQKSAEYFKKNK